MIQLKDISLKAHMRCPVCDKKVKAEVKDVWSIASTEPYGNSPVVEENELTIQCPKCEAYLTINING